MKKIIPILILSSACSTLPKGGSDGGGDPTTTGEDMTSTDTKDVDTTVGESTSGAESGSGSGEWLAPTTGGDSDCGRIVWVHANPPPIPGVGGSEWSRTFAVDLFACNESHDVSLLFVPDDDSNGVIGLGERKPGCIITGGPLAKIEEPFSGPIGTGTWHGVTVALLLDGVPSDVVELPADIIAEDQPLVQDGIGAFVARRFGIGWKVLAAPTEPSCW
jgi:hypothetical protein